MTSLEWSTRHAQKEEFNLLQITQGPIAHLQFLENMRIVVWNLVMKHTLFTICTLLNFKMLKRFLNIN